MVQKIQGGQKDFSGGQIDPEFKRADDNPTRKAACRQMLNWRILSANAVKNRSGRVALFLEFGRVEEIRISPTNNFFLAFGNGYLRVYNAAGAKVFESFKKGDGTTNLPWTTASVKNITWAIPSGNSYSIYIGYGDAAPLNVPQVLSWDGVSQTSTWTLATFAEAISGGGQKRTAFYRISPQSVTMLPSATTGNITIQFSQNILVAGMIGTRMRFANRQILITGVTDGMNGAATVIEPLPPAQNIAVSGAVGIFNLGDELVGASSGATGILTRTAWQQFVTWNNVAPFWGVGAAVTGASSGATGVIVAIRLLASNGVGVTISLNTATPFATGETINGPGGGHSLATAEAVTITVQLLSNVGASAAFTASELIVGPSGSATVSSVTTTMPQAISVWDDEVMNLFRGYPTSIFFDQNRLGFCNFPSVPSGIAWSAIGTPTDFYVGAQPDNAIFEIAPAKSQVLYVIAGPESSEMVLCDNGIYYIPISVTNPLKPGSVAFNLISQDGCAANVQPRVLQDVVLFINAGLTSVLAVTAPGAYNRPYEVNNLSTFHSDLIKTPIAIAAPSTSQQFDERYAYVLNSDGTLAVGKYDVQNGIIRGVVGWVPFNGAGSVNWISTISGRLTMVSTYAPAGASGPIAPVGIVERLDENQYLDAAMTVNSPPAALAAPGGKGPLWYLANGSVTLMDQVTRMMGTYQIDANGFIIPQFNGGENLTAATLVAGQPWTAILEPFVPDANSGADVGQRMFKRRVSRMAVYVMDSTGFLMARLFSGPITPTSPALGTIMNTYRVTTWNQGDDPTKPPPLREEVERWRPIGRAFDPRVAVIKDTPGPLKIAEFGMEATI